MDTLHLKTRPRGRRNTENTAQPAWRKSMPYRLAAGVAAWFRQVRAFLAGLLIGLSIWTPIFAATTAVEADWQQFGLPGGLAMFGAGVWLRMGRPTIRGHSRPPRNPSGPSRSGMDRLPA